MNCTVKATDGTGEIRVGSQSPERVRDTAADLLGIPAGRVKVHTLYLGRGFGRRGNLALIAPDSQSMSCLWPGWQKLQRASQDCRGKRRYPEAPRGRSFRGEGGGEWRARLHAGQGGQACHCREQVGVHLAAD